MANCLKFKKHFAAFMLLVLAVSTGLFALSANQAQAKFLDWFPDPTDAIISVASDALYYLFLRPVSWFLSLAGILLDWTFNLEHFTDVAVVKEGWGIARDLTNMFFVLILLTIAFASILRVEKYGMKAILPKLIAVALLINFSLVFCGAVIDFSQVLTHFFLDPLQREGASVSQTIAQNLNIVKIFERPEEAPGLDALNILIGLIGGVAVLLVAAFIIGAAAFFLLVRVVAIWLLLVLVPIALFSMILPALGGLWDRWMNNFLKWTFFAPIFAFFFYLAVLTIAGAKGEGGFLTKLYSRVPIGKNENFVSAFFSSNELILQYIFLILLLGGGLVVAQSMSIYGAKGTMDLGKKWGKGIGGWVGSRSRMAGMRPIGGRIGETGDRIRQALEKTPGVRQFVRPLRKIIGKERSAIGEAEKKYTGYTSDNLKTEFGAANPRDKAAIGKILAERGDFEANDKIGFTEKDTEEAFRLTKRYDQHKNILKARPEFASQDKDINPSDKEAVQKAITEQMGKLGVGDIGKLQSISFNREKNPMPRKISMPLSII